MNIFSRSAAPPAAEAASPLDVGLENFVDEVLTASNDRIVVVDFWAPWCGPCKQIAPLLEKAAAAAGPAVKLVKINIDDNQEIAAQLRIQSIPAVFAFFRGKPIDGFVGAQPQSQIKAFLDRAVQRAGPDLNQGSEDSVTALLEQGEAALISGDFPAALDLYSRVLAVQPESAPAAAGIARCYLADGDAVRAKGILDNLSGEAKKDQSVQSALAAVGLAERGRPLTGGIADLEKRLAADSADHAARHDLSLARFAAGDAAGAVEGLFEIIRRDRTWNEEAGRKTLLEVFAALGSGHPLTRDGRRKLSALLFS